jgi:hypothetical protein
LLFAGLSLGCRADAAPTPTVAVTAKGPIAAFAQEGDWLAWWVRTANGGVITVRSTESGADVVRTRDRGDPVDADFNPEGFGVSRARVVWSGFEDCCNDHYGAVGTTAPGSPPRAIRQLFQSGGWAFHHFPVGVAGLGDGTLVYGLATIEPVEVMHPFRGWRVTGGGVWRVVGTKMQQLPGTPPPALLAGGAGAIALVPADREKHTGLNTGLRVPRDSRVEVRDGSTGAMLTSFTTGGRAAAVAVDAETVAVLARTTRSMRIAWFARETGRPVGSVVVPPDVAATIGVAGNTIVFRRNMRIFTLDTVSRRVDLVASAAATPVGLSIVGHRVAWAETPGPGFDGYSGRGVVREVRIP